MARVLLPLDAPSPGQVPPCVLWNQHYWLGADRWNRDPRTGPKVANSASAPAGPSCTAGKGTHNLLRAHLAVALLAELLVSGARHQLPSVTPFLATLRRAPNRCG